MELAKAGVRVGLVERQRRIGPKVCAGGITWHGLIRDLPKRLIQRRFPRQRIYSNLQQITISKPYPLVATIDRTSLGQWMAARAAQAGAELLTGCRVTAIGARQVQVRTDQKRKIYISCNQLVGADGATSLVRRSLGLSMRQLGWGINYQIPGHSSTMEWHLNQRLFGCGYGWIFPHADSISIGAYTPVTTLSAATFKRHLLAWAARQGFDLRHHQGRAARINFDYQGYHFDHTWLVGDAAGLASGLTGEGIYPAMVSGRCVARQIIDPQHPDTAITAMVRKQRYHHWLIRLAGKHPRSSFWLMELLVLLLRIKVLDFHVLEMAD